MNQNQSKVIGLIVTIEGLSHYFGKNQIESKIDYQLACFYLKLGSSEYGNSIAQFYYGLMIQLQLDGSFQMRQNLKGMIENQSEVLKQIMNDDDQIDLNILSNYVMNRWKQMSFLYQYTSATQNNGNANVVLGNRYMNGINIPQNCSTAAFYYYQAVKLYYSESVLTYTSNRNIYERESIEEQELEKERDLVYRHFIKSQQQEDIENLMFLESDQSGNSLFLMGFYNQFGQMGLLQDYSKAIEYYELAYEKGHKFSGYMTANLYLNGQSGRKDSKKALQIFRHLYREHNYSHAINGLGFMYENGIEVDQNVSRAHELYQLSVKKGSIIGYYNLGMLLLDPQNTQIQRDIKKGIDLLTSAAKDGHQLSQIAVGLQHLDGSSTFYNCKLGVSMLQNSIFKANISSLNRAYKQLSDRHQQLNCMLVLSLMGDQTSLVNSVLLIDQNQYFNQNHLDYHSLIHKLNNDRFMNLMKSKFEQFRSFDSDHIFRFYYSDYIQVLSHQNPKIQFEQSQLIINTILKQKYYLHDLNNVTSDYNKKLGYYLISNSRDPSLKMTFKLGFYQYNGYSIDKPNYLQARQLFSQVLNSPNAEIRDRILSGFYLMDIYEQGLGLDHNSSRASEVFNLTQSLYYQHLPDSNTLIPFQCLKLLYSLYHSPSITQTILSEWNHRLSTIISQSKVIIKWVIVIALVALQTLNYVVKWRKINMVHHVHI